MTQKEMIRQALTQDPYASNRELEQRIGRPLHSSDISKVRKELGIHLASGQAGRKQREELRRSASPAKKTGTAASRTETAQIPVLPWQQAVPPMRENGSEGIALITGILELAKLHGGIERVRKAAEVLASV